MGIGLYPRDAGTALFTRLQGGSGSFLWGAPYRVFRTSLEATLPGNAISRGGLEIAYG